MRICKRIGLLLLVCFAYMLFVTPAFAASNPISNGWYMIACGSSDDRVLDINNWNMNNGGNLEIYQKNGTTNQIFWVQYRNNGYYTLEALHSGKYIHISYAGTTANVHQYQECEHSNAQWEIIYAGNGYYYLRNRSTGSYLDNSNGSTALGNNVISYSYNGSNAQKWKFIRVNSIPSCQPRMRQANKLSGTYDRNTSQTTTMEFQSNYPITRVEVSVYNSSGKDMNMTGSATPNMYSFRLNHTFNFSKLSAGSYYYLVKVWYLRGYAGTFGKYSFSIKENVNNTIIPTSEIERAARTYGIGNGTTAYRALELINSKYYNQLKDNLTGINIFLFEGAGANPDSNKRENALCVVIENKKIKWINRNSSTLPDYPFIPEKNYSTSKSGKKYKGTTMPTLKSGVYRFGAVNHKDRYAALKLYSLSGGAVPVLRYDGSSWLDSSSTAINVHRKTSNSLGPRTPRFDQNTWVNSAGCQTIGKVSEYPQFVRNVGIVGKNWTNGLYKYDKSGYFVVDRTYARSYMTNIGYADKTIDRIG